MCFMSFLNKGDAYLHLDLSLNNTLYPILYMFALLHFFTEVWNKSNSACRYSGYPELWILRYPAHRYRAGIRTHDPLVESPTS
jgi:hypothetical protein